MSLTQRSSSSPSVRLTEHVQHGPETGPGPQVTGRMRSAHLWVAASRAHPKGGLCRQHCAHGVPPAHGAHRSVESPGLRSPHRCLSARRRMYFLPWCIESRLLKKAPSRRQHRHLGSGVRWGGCAGKCVTLWNGSRLARDVP